MLWAVMLHSQPAVTCVQSGIDQWALVSVGGLLLISRWLCVCAESLGLGRAAELSQLRGWTGTNSEH